MLSKKILCLSTIAIVGSIFVTASNIEASQIPDNNSSEIVKSLDTTDKSYNLSKDKIFYNMLNAIDNYNSVSGELIYYSSILEHNSKVTYDLKKSKDNILILTEEDNNIDLNMLTKIYSDGKTYKTINSLTNEESVYNVAPVKLMTEKEKTKESRMYLDENGDPCYVYRPEMGSVGTSGLSVNPEMIAMGFMGDFNNWDITGYETLLNRKCAVVEGIFNESYKNKMQAENFKIYIDAQTGILLKFSTFDNNGTVIESLETKNITIQ